MKTNLVLVSLLNEKTKEIAEKLATDFELYYADIEEILNYKNELDSSTHTSPDKMRANLNTLLSLGYVVEDIKADAGIDIGLTLIGMHLKKVAVPVRLNNNQIGEASISAARTRPKFIGGIRAVYDENLL